MRKIATAIAAALALIGASAGITLAAVSTNGVIYACYSNRTHALYHATSATCARGYTSLRWSVQGPQGPPGPSTAGPTGLHVVEALGQNIYPDNPDVATATCPSGWPYVVGGGFAYTGYAESGGVVADSHPALVNSSVPNAWVVIVNGATGNKVDTIMAYALCSK